MRYIRNFVIGCIFLLSLSCALPAHAVDSLFKVSGCSDDPAIQCQTTGDGTNMVLPLTQSQEITTNVVGSLLGQEGTMQWYGEIRPAQDIYDNENKKLKTYANQVQTASDIELQPDWWQTNEQHDQSSKPTTMTSRLCVLDQTTGEMKSVVSETIIVTEDQPWVRTYTEAAQRTAALSTQHTKENPDYRLPETIIQPEAAPPCGSQMKGQLKPQEAKPSQYENIFGNAAGTVLRIAFRILEPMIRILYAQGPDGPYPVGETATVAQYGGIFGAAQNPYVAHTNALVAGCATKEDLTDNSYTTQGQKEGLCPGGFVNEMYRQEAGMPIDKEYKSALHAVHPNQEWDQNIAVGPAATDRNSAFARRLESASEYMNCTLYPSDAQYLLPDQEACKENWVNAQPPGSASGSCEDEFAGMTPNPSQYAGFSPSGGGLAGLGFDVDIHNTNCTVGNINAVADFAYGWGAGNPTLAKNNVIQYYPIIEQYAKQYGWSPAYLLTQWIEETIAGSMGDLTAQLGCLGPNRTQSVLPGALCEQMACVFNIPNQMDFWAWMCNYAGLINSGIVNNHCTSFNFDGNQCYPVRFLFIYNEVIRGGNVTASGCAASGTVSPALRLECPYSSILDTQ